MRSLSIFQIVVLMIFGLFVLAGFIVTALYSNSSEVGGGNLINITVWGTFPQSEMRRYFDTISADELNFRAIYSQKNEADYDRQIVEAIADGQSPDIILITQADLIKHMNRIYPVSYSVFSARDFKDSFLEIGELFLSAAGSYAMPFSVDPLVMYWNRDLLTSAGLANPPRYWDEMYYYTEKLVKKDVGGAITTAAVALGDYQNIGQAKKILSGMFLQKGVGLVYWQDDLRRILMDFGEENGSLDGAIDFYTQFSNVTKTSYTWNRSLVDAKNLFIGGKLGIYFGPASEMSEIKSKNPNLNFDVATLPQLKNSSFRATFGDVYGFAVLKNSKQISTAIKAVLLMTSRDNIAGWASTSGTAPVRKDLKVSANSASLAVFQDSAIISRGWLDPDKAASDQIFSDMISAIVSGREEVQNARSRAASQMRALVPRL